jgi:hypothetical protein
MVAPVVPDIKEDEHIWSWIDRLAARYGSTSVSFLGYLLPENWNSLCKSASEQVAILLNCLAEWTGVDRTRLECIRFTTSGGSTWCRGWTAWCAACVRDDVRSSGEIFGRQIWSAHYQIVCDIHLVPLTDRCPLCMQRTVKPTPVAGRLRLFCSSCSTLVDNRVASDSGLSLLSLLVLSKASLKHLCCFQRDLRHALDNSGCQNVWSLGSDAQFVEVVTDLSAAFIGPPLDGRPSDTAFSSVGGVADTIAGLAAAASVVAAMNGNDIDIRYVSAKPALELLPLGLDVFLQHIGYVERVWLIEQRRDLLDWLYHAMMQGDPIIIPNSIYTGVAINPRGAVRRLTTQGEKFAERRLDASKQTGLHHDTQLADEILQEAESIFMRKKSQPNQPSGLKYSDRRKSLKLDTLANSVVIKSKHAHAGEPLTSALSRALKIEQQGEISQSHERHYGEIVEYLHGRTRRLILMALMRSRLSKVLLGSSSKC